MTASSFEAGTAPARGLPIDGLRPCPGGRYADHRVVVRRGHVLGITAARLRDGRIEVTHRLPAARVDDELGPRLVTALAPLTGEHDVFARAFTGLVLTTDATPTAAWERFYRNSLALLDHPSRSGYSALYRHAIDLLPRTSVLDAGCSFGFLGLHLAALGVAVTACDVDAGTTVLLRTITARLGRRLDVRTASGARLPAASNSVDAVCLLHVLEHVDATAGAALLHEAQRVARRRVVVAVPYEAVPTALYGHVRTLDNAALSGLGAASGWSADVHDHLGGWLVLDRPATPGARSPGRVTDQLLKGELQ